MTAWLQHEALVPVLIFAGGIGGAVIAALIRARFPKMWGKL